MEVRILSAAPTGTPLGIASLLDLTGGPEAERRGDVHDRTSSASRHAALEAWGAGIHCDLWGFAPQEGGALRPSRCERDALDCKRARHTTCIGNDLEEESS